MYRTILTLAVLIALSAATILPAAAARPRARGGYVAHHPRGNVHYRPGRVYGYGGYYSSYPRKTYQHYRSMHHYGYPKHYYGSYYPSYYGGSVGVHVPGFSLHIGY